jgi:excisionase family DNA binding protein
MTMAIEQTDEMIPALMREMKALRTEVAKLGNMVVYTTTEAAEYLRCTEEWLRKAAKAGKIEHFLVGRDMRFRKPDLDAYKATPIGQKAIAKLQSMAEGRWARVAYGGRA